MTNYLSPSNLEMQALSVLWHYGPSTVASVSECMPDGKVRAYTTILTLFQNLEKKGHVRKEKSGRAYIYEAAQPKESVIAEAVEEFVINTFCGHLPKAILFLLAAARLSAEEKDEIQKVLQKSKTRRAKHQKCQPVRKRTKREIDGMIRVL